MSAPASRTHRLLFLGSTVCLAFILIVIGEIVAHMKSSRDDKTTLSPVPPPLPRSADFHGRDYIPLGANRPDLEVTIAPLSE